MNCLLTAISFSSVQVQAIAVERFIPSRTLTSFVQGSIVVQNLVGRAYFAELKRKIRLRTRVENAVIWAVRRRVGWLGFQNWWFDRRYGGWCGGVVPSPFSDSGAMPTQSADYRALKAIFNLPELKIHSEDILVDVGCGKGRVLNYWLSQGLSNRMIGVELNSEIAAKTRTRLMRFHNVKVVTGDIVKCYPRDGTLFFLYNPFRIEIMQSFVEKLRNTALSRKNIRIAYLNSRCLEAFSPDQWQITSLPVGLIEDVVLICPKA